VVKAIRKEGRTVHVCEVCGLGYADEATAEECERFCRERGACSLEITRRAVYIPRR
jgi:hypothetical protein